MENLLSSALPHLHNSLQWGRNAPRLAIRALPRTNPLSSPLLTAVCCSVACFQFDIQVRYCYYSCDLPSTPLTCQQVFPPRANRSHFIKAVGRLRLDASAADEDAASENQHKDDAAFASFSKGQRILSTTITHSFLFLFNLLTSFNQVKSIENQFSFTGDFPTSHFFHRLKY